MKTDLTIKSEEFDGITYAMYDAQGRIVAAESLNSNETTIEVKDFAPGQYSLILFKQSQKIKTFKLIKNN